MKKAGMKLLSVLLSVLMIVPMLTPVVFAGNADTMAYVAPSKIGNYVRINNKAPSGGTKVPAGIYPKGVHFDEGGTPYWSFNYSNTQLFVEFDLSAYAGKDIKKVELIVATDYQEYSYSRYFRMYDITGDWTVDGANSILPSFDEESLFTNFDVNALFLNKYSFKLTEANRAKYPEDIFDYKYATGYDITEFVLSDLSSGKTKTDFACWLDYNVQRIEEIGLFVEYADNFIPSVELKLDKTVYTMDEDVVLKAVATDSDNDNLEVTFTLDVSAPVNAVYEDGYYVYEYPAGSIAKGRHTVKATVTDEKGSIAEDISEITVGSPDGADNNPPYITLLADDEYPILTDAHIDFTVNDVEYDKIEAVTAALDGVSVSVVEYTGDDYAVNIPGELLDDGNHELVITAADIWGESYSETYVLNAGGNQRLYKVSEPKKLGNYMPSTGGIYTRLKKPQNSNLYISGGFSDQLIFSEYDLSEFDDVQVEKVELVIKPNGALYKARHATLYEILSDWTVTNEAGHGIPEFSAESIANGFARVTYEDSENLTDIGYPEVASDYKYAIDISEFALGKLADNEPVFDFVIIGDHGRIGGLAFGLLVTYRDNDKPVIETDIEVDEEISISVEIDDKDGIDEISVEFDGVKQTTSKSGDTYTVNVDSDIIFGSAHTVNIRAVDSFGAVSYKTENVYISVTDRVSYAAKGLIGADDLVSASSSANKVNSDNLLIEKFYIGNYFGKTIENVELSISDVNVYTTSDEWNITSEKPGLDKAENLTDVIAQAVENGEEYISVAVGSENEKVIDSFMLDITYTEDDSFVADRLKKSPLISYNGAQIFAKDGCAVVNVSDNHTINYINYPYAIVVYDTTETVVETKNLDFSDRYAVEIPVRDIEDVEEVIFASTMAIANKPVALEFVEYKNGVYKGDSADFTAQALGTVTAFSDACEFTVDGASSDGTYITKDGHLKVAEDETAEYLRVRAQNKRYPSLGAYCDVRVLDVPTSFDEDNIVLKVGVLSDIHLYGTYDAQQPTKFRNAMKTMQTIAGGKNELDALLISGDITQTLSYGDEDITPESAFTQTSNFRNSMLEVLSDETLVFYALGNHDTDGEGTTDQSAYTNIPKYFVNVLSGVFNYKESGFTEADDEYNSLNPETGETFERFYAYDLDMSDSGIYYGNRHAVYNGYHFIAVEPTGYSDIYYSAETRLWLREHLEMAANDAPNQPIFVITHTKLQDTTKGSEPGRDQMSADITPILEDYPQVFLWTGHTHDALNRVNAIMQKGFTALEGSTTQGVTIKGDRHPFESGTTWNPDPTNKGKYFTGQGQVLELDAHGNVRITKFDTVKSYNEVYSTKFVVKDPKYAESLAEIGTPWVINDIGADGAHLYAYDDSRKASNSIPYFESDARLVAVDTSEGIEITFDAATDDDGQITLYIVRSINNKTGEYTDLELSSCFMWYPDSSDMPESYTWTMTELDGEANDYSFEIYAYDDWDVVGRPLTLTQSGEVELEIISQSKVADGYSVVVEATNNTGNKASELLIRVGVGNNNKDSIIIDNLTLEPGATQSYTVFINSDVSGLSAYADFAKDGGVPGDVNADGKVDRKDLNRLAQYFARWDVEIDEVAADANGDGKVDRKDINRLAQYFARWDVELGK